MKSVYQLVSELIENGLTQTDIARETGMLQGQISRIVRSQGDADCYYESGKRLEALLDRVKLQKSA